VLFLLILDRPRSSATAWNEAVARKKILDGINSIVAVFAYGDNAHHGDFVTHRIDAAQYLLSMVE
jgi:hypothetical protein